MTARSALHRPVAVLAAVALAAGVAGCGGGGSDDGGSGGGGSASESYAATWNGVCRSLSTAQTTLQSDGVAAQKAAGSDPTKLAKAFGPAVARFAGSLGSALSRVQDLDAPAGLEGFQAKVARSAPATIRILKDVEAPLKAGDLQATQDVIARIDQKNLVPTIPARLKTQATACNVF